MKFKKGDILIYPQHGACQVQGTKKMEFFGEKHEYLILKTVINEMTLKVPVDKMPEDARLTPLFTMLAKDGSMSRKAAPTITWGKGLQLVIEQMKPGPHSATLLVEKMNGNTTRIDVDYMVEQNKFIDEMLPRWQQREHRKR